MPNELTGRRDAMTISMASMIVAHFAGRHVESFCARDLLLKLHRDAYGMTYRIRYYASWLAR